MSYSKIGLIASFVLSVLIFSACSDNAVNTPDVNEYNGFGPENNPLYYSNMIETYLEGIDTTKIVGTMRLNYENENYMWTDGRIMSSRTYTLDLRSSDANGTAESPFGECRVNDGVAEKMNYPHNAYIYQCRGTVGYDEDFKLYFGAENHFKIAPNSYFYGVDTNITFFKEPLITNHKNCDTISKSDGLNLTWDMDLDYAFIEFYGVDIVTLDDGRQALYFGNCVLENTGEYNFPPSQMKFYPNGLYKISVTSVKPYFLTDSQGRIIVTTVESKQTIGIVLTD